MALSQANALLSSLGTCTTNSMTLACILRAKYGEDCHPKTRQSHCMWGCISKFWAHISSTSQACQDINPAILLLAGVEQEDSCETAPPCQSHFLTYQAPAVACSCWAVGGRSLGYTSRHSVHSCKDPRWCGYLFLPLGTRKWGTILWHVPGSSYFLSSNSRSFSLAFSKIHFSLIGTCLMPP